MLTALRKNKPAWYAYQILYSDYKTQATFGEPAFKISAKIEGQPSSSTETGERDIAGELLIDGRPRNMSKALPAGTMVRELGVDLRDEIGVDGADIVGLASIGTIDIC